MANKDRYTIKQVCEALRGTRGIKSVAAERLGCSWDTVHSYINRYPTVARVFREEREAIVDTAEAKLLQKLREDADWAIKYVLDRLGRDRGYGETLRQELLGKGGNPIEIALKEAAKLRAEELRNGQQG